MSIKKIDKRGKTKYRLQSQRLVQGNVIRVDKLFNTKKEVKT